METERHKNFTRTRSGKKSENIVCLLRQFMRKKSVISLRGGKTKNDIQKYETQCLARDF